MIKLYWHTDDNIKPSQVTSDELGESYFQDDRTVLIKDRNSKVVYNTDLLLCDLTEDQIEQVIEELPFSHEDYIYMVDRIEEYPEEELAVLLAEQKFLH